MVSKPWLFFYPNIPILSTIPNLLLAFSVHLMNCYFSDFWYSHVTEKRTSEGRNAICEKSRTSCGSKVHYGNRWRNRWLNIWKRITQNIVNSRWKQWELWTKIQHCGYWYFPAEEPESHQVHQGWFLYNVTLSYFFDRRLSRLSAHFRSWLTTLYYCVGFLF